MEDLPENIVFDRAVRIDAKNFDRLIEDPEGYLKEIGALDGLEGFNGLQDMKGVELSSGEHSLKELCSKKDFVILGHYGIPYNQDYYCWWVVH